jgi:hypothetical protein
VIFLRNLAKLEPAGGTRADQRLLAGEPMLVA